MAVVSPEFVGREAALAALSAAFGDTAAAPGVALISGEAGIGKSRLVAEFTAALGDEVRVVTGGCTASGDGLAYAAVVALLRPLIRDLTAERAAELLPGPGRELARWFPELGTGHHGDRVRLYEETLTLIERATPRRLVLVVEDLHWVDAATAELLGFLARNLTRPGVLLVVTHRDTDAASGPLLSELRRGPRATRLRLRPLSRREVSRQLTGILGDRPDPATARLVHERSDGNPLFVEALARGAHDTPDSELLLYVPGGLSDPCRRVLRAASVAETEVAHHVLALVSGVDEPALDDLVRPLVDHGLLAATHDGYTFRHALIRDAVYRDLLPGQRRRLNARYVDALRDDGTPAQLAAHTYAAGQRGPALDAAWRAARAARDAYAYREEARMLARILELWDDVPDAADRLGVDRVAIGSAAAESCMLGGDYARGIGFATDALSVIDEQREPRRAAVLLEHRGRLRDRVDATGIDDLRHAHALLTAEPEGVDSGRLLGLQAMAVLRGDIGAALGLAESALRIGLATGDPTVTVRGLLGVGGVTGQPQLLAEALSITEAIRDHDLEITALMYLAMHHAGVGDHAAAARFARDGMDRAQRLGLARSRGTHLAGFLAKALVAAGRWDEADTVVETALAEGPPPMSRDILRAVAGQLALLRGDTATATSLADDLADDDGDDRLGTHFFHRYGFRCLAALTAGDLDRAERLLDRVLTHPAVRRVPPVEIRPVLATGARIRHARLASATRPRHDVTELNDSLPVGGPLDRAWRDTVAAMTTGDDPGRWPHVVAAWRELAQPYELALTLHIGAEITGNRAWARESADITRRLGAAPLTVGDTDTAGLTERELEVLALIADGLSNRRIAAALHISPSTAGVHVSHILGKLGATTRTEAATIAHKRGILEP